MPLPEHITYQLGGTVTLEPPTRPTNALITIYQGTGAIVVNNTTASVATFNTTTAAAVNARAKSLTLSNASGLSSGDRFQLAEPVEWCKAKSISGNAVTLWHPLREAHANNVVACKTLVTFAVNAASAASTFWDGRARWEVDSNAVYWTGVECSKYPLRRVANEQTLLAIHPQFAAVLEAEADPDAALDAAHDHVLLALGAAGRARVYPGSTEFCNATALALARNHYRHQSSAAAKELFDRYSAELDKEIERLMASIIPDDDQSGAVDANEKRSYSTFHLVR